MVTLEPMARPGGSAEVVSIIVAAISWPGILG